MLTVVGAVRITFLKDGGVPGMWGEEDGSRLDEIRLPYCWEYTLGREISFLTGSGLTPTTEGGGLI